MNDPKTILACLQEQLHALEGILHRFSRLDSGAKSRETAHDFAEKLGICSNDDAVFSSMNQDNIGALSFLEIARRLNESIEKGMILSYPQESNSKYPYSLISSVVIWFIDSNKLR
jgi:hypothetical protein